MCVVYRALVGAEQPALRQRRDPVHAGQQPVGVVTRQADSALATALPGVAEALDACVALPAIGDHRRARLDVFAHEPV